MSNNTKQDSLVQKFYSDIMPVIYGLGAALVIIGAMFKLLNLNGASTMLAVGLTTEAILFILGAFEPKHKDYDWSKVYPELVEEPSDESLVEVFEKDSSAVKKRKKPSENLEGIDKVLTDIGLNNEVLNSLEGSMTKIASYSQGLASMVDVAKFSDEYCENLSKASTGLRSIVGVNDKIASTISNMSFMADNNTELNTKMTDILSTLSELNDSYKKEVSEVGQRINSLAQVSGSMQNIAGDMLVLDSSVKDFKKELSELNKKFQSLNAIYGNMLNSFKI